VENKWRAIRHGLDAQLIRNENGDLAPLVGHLRETAELLAPVAERLGCLDELGHFERILEAGNSSMRQHRTFERTHDLRAVVDALALEFETDRMGADVGPRAQDAGPALPAGEMRPRRAAISPF
jgi:carboxylate-amine ligase